MANDDKTLMPSSRHNFQSSRVDCFPCIRIPARIQLLDPLPPSSGLGSLARFIRRYYAPFLLKPVVKGAVLLIFGGFLASSIISMQQIQLGLGMPSTPFAFGDEVLNYV